jgi:hypothetical protein
MGESRDVAFLDDVFGFGAITQHAARDPIQPPIVTLHDRSESVRVAVEHAPHQFGIVQISGNGFPDCPLHHDRSFSHLRCIQTREVPRGSAERAK